MASPHSGKLVPSRREVLWLREDRVCHWCQQPTSYVTGTAWDAATVDHILPVYKGGTNDESNLVSACRLCNDRRNYEDQMGLPEGVLLGRYPVPPQRGVQRSRRGAMLRHAFPTDNSTGKGAPVSKSLFDSIVKPVSKSIFDSERAFYNRSQSGSEKSFNFDIENMSSNKRQLFDATESILFRLATEVTQKTSATLKEKPRKPLIDDEVEALKAEVAELRQKIEEADGQP